MTRLGTHTSATARHRDSGLDLRKKLNLQRDHASRHYQYFNDHKRLKWTHRTARARTRQSRSDTSTEQPAQRLSLHLNRTRRSPPDIHNASPTARTSQESTPESTISSPATRTVATARPTVICGYHRHNNLFSRPRKIDGTRASPKSHQGHLRGNLHPPTANVGITPQQP